MTNGQSQQDLNEQLKKFCDNMKELEQMSAKFSEFYFELMDQPDNRENMWSKLDANVTCSLANASLYGLYLMLKGTELQDHPIKEEMLRVRKYHQELEFLKKDAPKLNVRAAKNFVRNALWDPLKNGPENKQKVEQAKPYQQRSNYYYNKDKNNESFNKRKRH